MSLNTSDHLEAALSKLALNMESNGRSLSPDEHDQSGSESRDVNGGHNGESSEHPLKLSYIPHVREGYGFRPASGTSTPAKSSVPETGAASPLPDPNGLGWPGTSGMFCRKVDSHRFSAKSTVARYNASPAERVAREQKLASAVRTILECIGEDPNREGLLRTPDRYAQALMWLTRGYEERLTGAYIGLRP